MADLRQTPTNFWTRRRAAVEAEARAEAEAQLAAEALAEEQALQAARAEKTDGEILTELGLADPDDMKMGDDFAAFMQKAVPEHLRRRALRKLWLSNPVLANLDGLLDHNDDFSDAATVMPDMKTTYQVGRGMLAHIEALAKAAEDKVVADSQPDLDAAAAVTAPDATEHDDADQAEVMTEPDLTALPDAENAEAIAAPVRARHLRFEFVS